MTHFKKKNKKSKSKFRNSFFDLKWKNEFQKISFIFQIWLMHWKRKHEKNFFWTYFDLKPISKKQKSKFLNSFFDFKSKNEFQKVLSFFNFCYEIEKWQTKFFQNSFCFEIKKRIILLVQGLIRALCHSFFSLKLNCKSTFLHISIFNSMLKIEKW